MTQKCNNPKDCNYYKYGALGVTVCDRWKVLNNFIEDVDKIDGFDLNDYLAGKLALDKDIKYRFNKEYCLEKCSFVSIQENNKVKPNQQRLIVGLSPSGQTYEFYNQSEFARQHKLVQVNISSCLRKKSKQTQGWEFCYK